MGKKHHILVSETIQTLQYQKKHIQLDYIFSIINSHILCESVIKLAKYGTINYHDSLLPNYAGVNATTWAIINDEKKHGITWHLINNKIDQGDILKQRTFPILEQDTAFTLNLRCYEFAITSFQELIYDIEHQQLTVEKQNLTHYNYYSIEHTLPNFGFIDWEKFSAEKINRLYRALSFGNYNNPVGTLKIYLANTYVVISKLSISNDKAQSQKAPGRVIAIDETGIYLSTITLVLKIIELKLQNGNFLSLTHFINHYKIAIGYQFKPVPHADIVLLSGHHSNRYEYFWVKSLLNTNEHSLFSSKIKAKLKKLNNDNNSVNLKNIFPNKKVKCIKIVLITAILIYLYRLNNHENISVFLVHKDFKKFYNQCAGFLAHLLPLNFNITNETLGKIVGFVEDTIAILEKKSIYQTDISIKYPVLHGKSIKPTIVINFIAESLISSLPDDCMLYFQINENKGTIETYHRFDLYPQSPIKEIINNLSQHITNILIDIINNPHFLVNNFSFLMPHERYKLVRILSQGNKKLISALSITSLFEKQVLLRPEQQAIIINHTAISYYQLWKLAEKIANFIKLKQLPEKSLIGVYFERSIEMLATILGILKANSTYVPIDTKYPAGRIQYIINKAQINILFTQEQFLIKLETELKESNHYTNIYCSEKIIHDDAEVLKNIGFQKNCLENLAYIMFTSGTTGVPKGVMVTQRNVLNYCCWFLEMTKFDNFSIMDFSCSIAFDLSIPCSIAPLLAGGTVAICSDTNKTNPKQYLIHLKEYQITHLEITPGYMHLLLNYATEIKQLKELKWLLLGADVVSKVDVLKWLSLCPNHQIINEYGPTETTVAISAYLIEQKNLQLYSAIPIGKPSYNTQCYILDKYKNLCPIGMMGELYIAGKQVSKGYLNQLDLTQEKFLYLNINKNTEVLYKTGDVVSWLPCGNLQFFGRNDSQIKIMGYRIEATEIELVLESIPQISQAIVVLKEGKYISKYLAAYLVCKETLLYDDEIRKIISSYLPAYMIPKEFYLINAIPLKENDKINYEILNKKKYILLTSHIKKLSNKEMSYQKQILEIWKKIFQNIAITIHDNFFEIGGDSLIALQIIDELQHQYSKHIQIRYLFEYPTVALLSQKLYELFKQKTCNKPYKINKNKIIIQLSEGAHPIPIFLIHPLGGTIFWYRKLARLLHEKYTIYGIQDPSIDNNSVKFASLAQMADYYISTIQSVYKGNYYNIGGASFGATVAFEMANQFSQYHAKINSINLTLLDGWTQYPMSTRYIDSIHSLKNIDLDSKLSTKRKNNLIALEQNRKILLRNYTIPLLSVKVQVSLFKAIEKWEFFDEINDNANGWNNYVQGNIHIYNIPGDHESMFFEPHVVTLANFFDKSMQLPPKIFC